MAEQDKDKWQGRGRQVTGDIKERVGKLTDDEEMAEEGRAEQAKGKVQETVGKAKEKLEDVAEDLKDKVKDR